MFAYISWADEEHAGQQESTEQQADNSEGALSLEQYGMTDKKTGDIHKNALNSIGERQSRSIYRVQEEHK